MPTLQGGAGDPPPLIWTLKNAIVDHLDKVLPALGASYTYEMRGKHMAVVITGTHGTKRVFIARTTSDWRAARNAERDCKRIMREVGYNV